MEIQEYVLSKEVMKIITDVVGYYNPIHQLEVTMLDGNGRRVYHDSSLLTVTIQNGTLLGIENGDLADVTEYTANYRRVYNGQLILYVAENDNTSADTPLTVTVHGDMVQTEVFVINL